MRGCGHTGAQQDDGDHDPNKRPQSLVDAHEQKAQSPRNPHRQHGLYAACEGQVLPCQPMRGHMSDRVQL